MATSGDAARSAPYPGTAGSGSQGGITSLGRSGVPTQLLPGGGACAVQRCARALAGTASRCGGPVPCWCPAAVPRGPERPAWAPPASPARPLTPPGGERHRVGPPPHSGPGLARPPLCPRRLAGGWVTTARTRRGRAGWLGAPGPCTWLGWGRGWARCIPGYWGAVNCSFCLCGTGVCCSRAS